MWSLDDTVDYADAIELVIRGHRRARWHDDDIGVGHVFEDDLLGLLHTLPDHLRPRRLAAGLGQLHFRRGAHRRSIVSCLLPVSLDSVVKVELMEY
uniref:Sci1 n=1 Tax=Arundo donax TaxID=35708 RepID=A0A0A9BJI2_ARUDO